MTNKILKPYELSLKKGIGYSLRRYYVDKFFHDHRKDFEKAKSILDLGGEKENKRGQFNLYSYSDNIVNVNLSDKKKPDVLADASATPFQDNKFDVIICSELLEHVPDPVAILKEIKRLLKKNGKAYITAPFMFPIHADPYDYGRYTPTFWKMVSDQLGLKIELINSQGAYKNVLVDMMRMGVYRQVQNRYLKFALYLPLRFLQRITFEQKGAEDNFSSSFTTGYEIILTKKS